MPEDKREIERNKGLVTAIVITASLFNLFFLYFLKYQNQNLSFYTFTFANVGNILNLTFTILLIFAALLYYWNKKKFIKPSTVIALTAVMTLFLIIAAVFDLFNIPLPATNFTRHPLNVILKAASLSLFMFMKLFIIFILWLSFLDKDKLLVLRAVMNSAVVVIMLLLFTYFFLVADPASSAADKDLTKNEFNVGVVLGAAVWSYDKPSPMLAGRVDKAAELYKKGLIDKIQLTGSNAPGELAESEVALRYLNQKGNFNHFDIWMESRTTSTLEQVHYIKKNILSRNNVDNVIIISDSYHLKRIIEICKFYNVKADVFASDLQLNENNRLYYKIRETIALLTFWLFAI
jgi:vancomycin permeability regulator SanA